MSSGLGGNSIARQRNNPGASGRIIEGLKTAAATIIISVHPLTEFTSLGAVGSAFT